MNISKIYRTIALLLILCGLTGCGNVFEDYKDAQARKALQDLMKIQNSFFQEKNRYARNLVEIEKYNLKYHSGIVYLEIEAADKNGYRAISLPAESTTARVFAFDSNKAGFYEMDDEEVSQYVLGALNFIRTEQKNDLTRDIFSGSFIVLLLFIGIKMKVRSKGQAGGGIIWPYFMSIFALSWALAIMGNMDGDIVFGSMLQAGVYSSLALGIVAFIVSSLALGKTAKLDNRASWLGMGICTIIISLFSGGVMVHALMTYSLS